MKTNMKKFLSVILSVLMLSSMFVFAGNAAIVDYFKPAGTRITDYGMLQNAASASSEANHTGNKDMGIRYALDGERSSSAYKWHQNYNGAGGHGTTNPLSASNYIDVDFRFPSVKKITGFVFNMRWDKTDGDGSCGIPTNYEIWVANNSNFNGAWKADEGIMQRWATSPIMVKKGWVEGQFIRLRFKGTYGGHFGCSELEVYEQRDSVETQITDYKMLKDHSSASSYANNGNDGGAYMAFDGIWDNRWHQNYGSGSGQTIRPDDAHRIWFQTGFNTKRMISAVTYVGRTDRDAWSNECGIPNRYRILTANDANFTDEVKVVKEGNMARQRENYISFEPVSCRYLRFEIITTHSHLAACAELRVFETRRDVLINDYAMLQRHAKTNSAYGMGNDGPVTRAFDGVYFGNGHYHQNYDWNNGSTWNPDTGRGGTADFPDAGNPIWIETGFDAPKLISKIRFTSRTDIAEGDKAGIPQNYQIQISEDGYSNFRTVKTGNFERRYMNEAVLDEPVVCKAIRLVSGPTHWGHFTCSEMEVYEVPRYDITLTKTDGAGGLLQAYLDGKPVDKAPQGAHINIKTANPDSSYYVFNGWNALSGNVLIDASGSEDVANFIMPGSEVRINASYNHYHRGVKVEAVAPTCSSVGAREYYHCECGRNFEDAACTREISQIDSWKVIPIDPTAHSMLKIGAIASTCTVQGRNEYFQCQLCKNYYKDELGTAPTTPETELLPLKAHNYGEWIIDTEATCTEDGAKHRVCADCGNIENAVIPAEGHQITEVPAKAPTCTAEGNKNYFHCSVCDKYFLDAELTQETTLADVTLSATDHRWDAGTVIKEATCKEDGIMLYTCLNDGRHTKEAVIHKNPDNHKGEVRIENAAPATCTADGYTGDKYCADCGQLIEKGEAIEKTGHNFVYKETVKPTCVSGGYDVYECENDHSHIEHRNETAKTGIHTPETIPGKEATCTTDGYTETVICKYCGSVITSRKVILAYGHDIVRGTAVPATCTHPGLTAGKLCSRCGEVFEKQEVIPMLSHSWEVYEAKAPTCTEAGRTEGRICKGCGLIEGSQEIPALGHSYVAERHEPTCTEAGYIVYTCKNDSTHTYTEEFAPATGHTGGIATCQSPAICSVCGKAYGEKGDHKYTATVVPPTCTKGGYTEYTCEYCGKTYIDDRTPAGVHSYDEGVVTLKPTCTENGEKTFTCTLCGASYVETIAAPGHKVDKWEVVDTKAKGTCTVCGEEITANPEDVGVEIPECERCGMRHTMQYGIFKYKGIYCSIVYFFRQVAAFFQNIGK